MSDGLVAFIIGFLVGSAFVLAILIPGYQGSLDQRCEVACAPLVGKDSDGACRCATGTGWVPLREAKP